MPINLRALVLAIFIISSVLFFSSIDAQQTKCSTLESDIDFKGNDFLIKENLTSARGEFFEIFQANQSLNIFIKVLII